MSLAQTTTTTTANESIANASPEITSGFASSMGLSGVVVLAVFVVTTLVVAQFAAPWLAKSELLSKVGAGFLTSFSYAIKGFTATVVLAGLAFPVYYLTVMADESTRGMVLDVVGTLLLGYVALVVIGVLADRAVSSFIDAHPRIDEWGDLFPGEDDDPGSVLEGYHD